ncbi:hypothetical protein [Oceanobacillus halotolerans]|nr:hypothetical protein [Oceanobacillus halotolerans]
MANAAEEIITETGMLDNLQMYFDYEVKRHYLCYLILYEYKSLLENL